MEGNLNVEDGHLKILPIKTGQILINTGLDWSVLARAVFQWRAPNNGCKVKLKAAPFSPPAWPSLRRLDCPAMGDISPQ